ncbi:hypothetical protein [Nocardia sp. NPDC057455]|uniref:hypothetical protein n=1 Tax=Nocardia sp. NPDC057455 TaxID=3346138 RepID=UPI00367208FF
MGRGRTYSRQPCAIWDNDRYLDLSPRAQHLYGVLSHHPDISHCGLVDWRPARLTPKSRTWTVEEIEIAAHELEETGWVLFDLGTEEALVRDHIRSDELLKNPKNTVAMIKAYGGIASRELRAGMVSELRVCRELQGDYAAWTSPISADRLDDLVARAALDSVDYRPAYADAMPEEYRIGSPITVGMVSPNRTDSTSANRSDTASSNRTGTRSANATGSRSATATGTGSPTRSGAGSAKGTGTGSATRSRTGSPIESGIESGIGSPITTPSTSPTTTGMSEASVPTKSHQPSTNELGYVPDGPAVARAPGPAREAPDIPPRPPQRCPAHIEFVSASGCGECTRLRRAAKDWDNRYPAAAAAYAAEKRAEREACELCDNDGGWRIPPPQLADEDLNVTCTHKPWPEEKWVEFSNREKVKRNRQESFAQ